MDRRSDQCASSFFSMFSLVCYEYVPKSQKILLLTILGNNETKNIKNDITQENVKNDWVEIKQYLFVTGQYTVLENQLVTFVKPGRTWFLWYELITLIVIVNQTLQQQKTNWILAKVCFLLTECFTNFK